MIDCVHGRRLVVAIDGPAGAGKSTIAGELARALGYVLLDTGALYRAVALAAQQQGVAWDDTEGVARLAVRLARADELRLEPAPHGVRVVLFGADVGAAIRTAEMSMGASRVSAIPGVRAALLELQRATGRQGGVIAEGRDIGTVVFPSADVKFFVTASIEVRAERRCAELLARGERADLQSVRAEVIARDRQDSERSVAPLRHADDARLVDTSGRTVSDIVAELRRIVETAAR